MSPTSDQISTASISSSSSAPGQEHLIGLCFVQVEEEEEEEEEAADEEWQRQQQQQQLQRRRRRRRR